MRYIQSTVYFPVIVGIHFVFWAIDLSFYEGQISARRVIGEVFSSWVVTVFAFNLLMSSRARWVERIFGGLDKMYVIHRRSGVIAVVLLLLHAITIPKTEALTIGKPMGLIALILILLGVVVSAAPPFKKKIKYHKWLNIHKAMGLFYVLGVSHALFVSTKISEMLIVRVYVFGMAAVGVLAWLYRVLLYRLMNKRYSYRVSSIRRFSEQLIEVTLTPDSDALEYKPGQFAFFRFACMETTEFHPFSISSHPSHDALRVSIKALGDYTSELQEKLEEGSLVEVEGPFGHFTQDFANGGKQIWIAGGIGITPFLSLAVGLKGEREVSLYWCVPNESEGHYTSELETHGSHIDFHLWDTEKKGYLTPEQVLPEGDLGAYQFLICGPSSLKQVFLKALKERHVKEAQIFDEEFSFR